jgi:dienelactone hydrolase
MPVKSRRPRALAVALACATALVAAGGSGASPLIEETLQIPVHGQTSTGVPFERTMSVASLREDGAGRRPYLILLHGRAPDAAARARLSVMNYPANSRYFASKGFIVFVPVRVGYGTTGGPDAEFTGDCAVKRFADGVSPAVVETAQLLAFAGRLPYVDASRGLIVGESFGGLVAIAAAAARLPGLKGVVNIAGGDGGDGQLHPDQPCRPDLLRDSFAAYGTSARIPSLWIYSANDRLWGPDYPRQWFAAFTAAGGVGRFEALPADKNNGHFVFLRNAGLWRPPFEAFIDGLQLQGLPAH